MILKFTISVVMANLEEYDVRILADCHRVFNVVLNNDLHLSIRWI